MAFDLHHGLPTRYSDFQKFIEEHFRMDVDHQYLWRQFENDLSTFDWESFFNRYNYIDVRSESFRSLEAFGLEDELVQYNSLFFVSFVLTSEIQIIILNDLF